MKNVLLLLLTCFWAYTAGAQQRIDTRKMSFIPGLKPNNILYNDTLYMGSRQFMSLFYRTRDQEIIYYYRKHQSNKIAGNILGVTGTLATLVGLAIVSDNSGTGWALAGAGFASTLAGGYLLVRGQQNLQTAVILFNNKYNNATLNLGLGEKRAGLTFNF
ncbi:hypothetical protein [Sediminibacterium soli]|uniref:hypothetical protein n=1 Tax=Sediminibacterium soli TaxID=2698829 RepID=UPI001379F978|nr:hypothetical protein [Sediminibacterium soli]NCI46030.1 hypothetical protein [Sediminibacterium soli]